MSKKNKKDVDPIKVIVGLGIIFLAVFGWYGLKNNSSKSGFLNFDDCAKKGGKLLKSEEFSVCADGNRAYLQYSAQNLPRIEQSKKTDRANTVEYSGSFSPDLISFLKYEDGGCPGYYKILKEVRGRFASMNYGCAGNDNTNNFIVAMKLGNGWALISPTNNFNQQGIPSCLMVDIFKISNQLSSECFESTGYNGGALRKVEYL